MPAHRLTIPETIFPSARLRGSATNVPPAKCWPLGATLSMDQTIHHRLERPIYRPVCATLSSPSSCARLAAAVREPTPSFCNTAWTWLRTVAGLLPSRSAISLLEPPCASSRRICSSASDSGADCAG
jgi:hypothetical protein